MNTKSKKRYDFSLILPCYNEAEHILKSVPEIIRTLETGRFSYEVIFVDDCSTDVTRTYIDRLVKKYPNTRVLKHTVNAGRGASVSDGIKIGHADIVGFIDIDCEVSPVYIPLFVAEIMRHKADVVVGQRFYPTPLTVNSLIRIIFSSAYKALVSKVLALSIHDTESGYKFFRRSKILPLLSGVKDTRWFWDTEIIAQSARTLTVTELPVLFLRNPGKTSTVNVLKDSVQYMFHLFHYWRIMHSV